MLRSSEGRIRRSSPSLQARRFGYRKNPATQGSTCMLPSMQGKAKQPSRRGKPLFYRSEMFEARKPDGRVAIHPNPSITFLRAVIRHKEIRRTGRKAHSLTPTQHISHWNGKRSLQGIQVIKPTATENYPRGCVADINQRPETVKSHQLPFPQ